MKNIPEKIFLQIDADGETPDDFNELSGVSWCSEPIHDNDIEYVLRTGPDILQRRASLEAFNKSGIALTGISWHAWKMAFDAGVEYNKTTTP